MIDSSEKEGLNSAILRKIASHSREYVVMKIGPSEKCLLLEWPQKPWFVRALKRKSSGHKAVKKYSIVARTTLLSFLVFVLRSPEQKFAYSVRPSFSLLVSSERVRNCLKLQFTSIRRSRNQSIKTCQACSLPRLLIVGSGCRWNNHWSRTMFNRWSRTSTAGESR